MQQLRLDPDGLRWFKISLMSIPMIKFPWIYLIFQAIWGSTFRQFDCDSLENYHPALWGFLALTIR